ncbi:hypothetical protein [Streptomyces sp. ME19-01-6]|uniref:hypothetical protein n=1 Tax=Streptomyces sp. ME19-01-6 TaxID=3028686 RepID=UPI0029A0C59A|nr:hypothetical protein [Streptomyces sp. ME19-01-6]MDX3225065.1 hypothetical protein [Streptomyces sp. ME19-01-6]
MARLTVAGGPARVLTAGTTPTGFGAEKPQGKDYCGANTKAKLTAVPRLRPPAPPSA